MKLTTVITRARASASYFSGRVFASPDASFAHENIGRFTLPVAFVVPASERAETREGAIGVTQRVEERCAVLVVVPNSATDLSLAAGDAVHDARSSLRSALDGWVPDTGYTPMQYAGGEILSQDKHSLWYAFEFTSISTGADADGEGGAIFTVQVDVDLLLNEGAAPDAVLSELAAKIATTTGGTRMASDVGNGLEAVSAGATKFQLSAVPGVDGTVDMNAVPDTIVAQLRIHHALSASEDERDWTQSATAQTLLPILMTIGAPAYWRVDGVDHPTEISVGEITRS